MGGAAKRVRLFQDRVEHRREIAGRGIDDPQYLGGRGLLRQRFVALGAALVEPLLQLGVRAPKFGQLVVERHRQELTPSHRDCELMILRSAAAFSARTVARHRVDPISTD